MDNSFNNTIKVIQVISTIVVVTLVAIVMYHGVIQGGFDGKINF